MLPVDWATLKAFIDGRGAMSAVHWVDFGERYWIKAVDGPFSLDCWLHKTAESSETVDFETNYKNVANVRTADSDGAIFSRPKQAPKGWTYQMRSLELETSILNSTHNKKPDGTSWGDATTKLYDEDNIEILDQTFADINCVKTVMDFEPLYDYELIGGRATTDVQPSNDVRLWVVGVPDVPEASGGSKVMISGINFKFIDNAQDLIIDGRSSKRLNYNATFHTNKLRFIFIHSPGAKYKFSISLEHFKA